AAFWAFGCVVYEILLGTRAFAGDDVSETIARVIEREPDWNALAKVAPRSVVRVVPRCIQNDPQNRFRDLGDVRLELRDALWATEKEAAAPDAIPIGRRGLVALIVAMLAAGLVLGVLCARW